MNMPIWVSGWHMGGSFDIVNDVISLLDWITNRDEIRIVAKIMYFFCHIPLMMVHLV